MNTQSHFKKSILLCLFLLWTVIVSYAQTWNPLGPGLYYSVYEITIHGTDVYAGGNFTNAGGHADADYVARWDGCDWHVIGTGLNGTVHAIAVLDQDIYVGGYFTEPYSYLARWDGTQWNPVDVVVPTPVHEIVIDGSNILIAGGTWNSGYIIRWDGNAGVISDTTLNGVVNSMVMHGTDVYAVGRFTDAGGNPDADGVAKWSGTAWQNLGTGVTSLFGSLGVWDCLMYDNELYIGGLFGDAGGNPNADGIAKWDGNAWINFGNGPEGFLGFYAICVFQGSLYTTVGAGWSKSDGIYRWDSESGSWEVFQLISLGADDPMLTLENDESNLYVGSFSGMDVGTCIARWGEQEDCSSTSAKDGTQGELSVFPNPVGDVIHYSIDSYDTQMLTLTLMDATGQIVVVKETTERELQIPHLPPGLYFLKIEAQGIQHVTKVMKY